MDFTLRRNKFLIEGIFGEMRSNNGDHFFTVERSYDLKPKLPDGVYKCVRGEHQLSDGKKFTTFEIMGVTGHWGILFHVMNYGYQSEGCVGLGDGMGRMMPSGLMLTASKQAFKRFMDLQRYCDEFELTVESSE